MKGHLTETVELRFRGPRQRKNKAIQALRDLGFSYISDAVPFEAAFPEYDEREKPGIVLAGIRMREELTQAELAERTGIPQSHISEMESGKRPIGAKTARILGKALNVGYKVFL
jgi:DNA-binding XRE family transcriptional regulator